MYENNIVWITGASSGIGKEMALQFAALGATVVISARRIERLDNIVKEIEARGQRALALKCDVSQEQEIKEVTAKIISTFERLDIVVANAGFGVGGKIESLSAEDWRRQFEVNVIGLVSTVNYSLPYLRKSNGRVVLMSSVASMVSTKGTGAYSASKAAVRSIGQTLSMELKGSGVSCVTLHPGFIDSEIGQVDNSGQYHEEWEDRRPKNLMWPTEKAVRVMLKAIKKRRRSVVITGHGKILAFFGRHFPGFTNWIMDR